VPNLAADLRFAFRSIRRHPAFAAVVILTLGLGIGANTAMFGVIRAALVEPLPYVEPDRLVYGRCTFQGRINPWASFPDYADYRDQADHFESLAATLGFPEKATVTGGRQPERAAVLVVTSNLFPTLGVRPAAGRWFLPEEGQPGGPDVVLVHESFARRWVGGAREAVGRQLTVDGSSTTVVGVMPASFRFLYDIDVWAPARQGEGAAGAARRFHNWLLVGRLKPGVSVEAAREQVDVISKRLEQQYPDSNRDKALRIDSLQSGLADAHRPRLLILMAAVGLVLLIACGNVAGLLLARGWARRSELAVRASLGASRSRLACQLLTESLVLAAASGVAGILLGVWLDRLLPAALGLDTMGVKMAGVEWQVLAFALALSAATGVLFGIVPAVRGARLDLSQALAPGARTTEGRSGTRLRAGLTAGEVALSLFLLAGAGLLVQSLARLAGTDPGFKAEHLLTGEIQLLRAQYPDPATRIAFFDGLREDLAAIPGVTAVGFSSHLPIRDPAGNYGVWSADNAPSDPAARPVADLRFVLPGYFAAVGIPLVAGRDIDRRDGEKAPRALVISEMMAHTLFHGRNAIGRRVMVDQGEALAFDVVGVVGDARINAIGREARMAMYAAYYQFPSGRLRLAVRTAGAPEAVTRTVRRLIAARDPEVPIEKLVPMEALISGSMRQQRVTTIALAAFSIVAMLLAAIGLYGVLAYFVSQRAREIGLRVALGAGSRAVLRMVLARAGLIVGAGMAAGLGASLAGGRLLGGLLYGVEANDPPTLAAVSLALAVVALSASVVPAWRAAHIDPMTALRNE
jgi:putative ABC transport system permease protein